ncbi:MAG TPA: helix-turn-helix domain-containing protein [Holophagaceae bacterium]|nr:helix-turn-helix domain-containing protein [Holophagaceae bacterium]
MREKLRNLVAELVRGGVPLEMALREFERLYIEEVLASHDGNQSAAARELGIHRNTLSRKLEPTPAPAAFRRAHLAS